RSAACWSVFHGAALVPDAISFPVGETKYCAAWVQAGAHAIASAKRTTRVFIPTSQSVLRSLGECSSIAAIVRQLVREGLTLFRNHRKMRLFPRQAAQNPAQFTSNAS